VSGVAGRRFGYRVWPEQAQKALDKPYLGAVASRTQVAADPGRHASLREFKRWDNAAPCPFQLGAAHLHVRMCQVSAVRWEAKHTEHSLKARKELVHVQRECACRLLFVFAVRTSNTRMGGKQTADDPWLSTDAPEPHVRGLP